MKTVLFFAGLVAVALSGTVPTEFSTKPVNAEFVERQKLVLSFLQNNAQINTNLGYYKIGREYDLEANVDNYTNKKAVEEFLYFYKNRTLPMGLVFSVYNELMREEAVALFHLFYYAKDFDTFYKTAAWARSRLNEGLFIYAFSVAVIHRADCQGLVLPAPYEVYPYFFVNSDVIGKLYRLKMQEGVLDVETANKYGIVYDKDFIVYSNYTGAYNYVNEEQKLSYFTEDIGLNSYYYYFHLSMPFWMNDNHNIYGRERRGEVFYYYHQQLLARYYLERLTNGLGEIPEFSWNLPIKTGYTPNLVSHTLYPFIDRNNYYTLNREDNIQELEYVQNYEQSFLDMLKKGHVKTDKGEIEFTNSKAINFVGDYWFGDEHDQKTENGDIKNYYQILGRLLLGTAGDSETDDYYTAPTVFNHFETALRDPAFYQLYKRIIYYVIEYKQYLEPYNKQTLDFVGVKINDVTVDKLVTFFDFFDFDAINAVQYNQENFRNIEQTYKIRQPRLNHNAFNVNVDIKSDVSTDAIVKIFLGPKYDSNGVKLDIEDNWMNFFILDMFKFKLNPGKNTVTRNSKEFQFFAEDSVTTKDIYKYLEGGKVPLDMSEGFFLMPQRMMLPKGTVGGYPLQMFVMVYPYVAAEKSVVPENFITDNKPFNYPLDRPADEIYFWQPNMYMKDVTVYYEGEHNVYTYNNPFYFNKQH